MNKNALKPKAGEAGFTLIEVMIVVAIVAVITAFAYPAYQDYVLKSNRGIGKAELMKVASRQEEFRADNKSYTGDLTDLGYPDPYYVDGRGDATTAADARYQIDLTASATGVSFGVRAQPLNMQEDDTACLSLGIDNRGRRFQKVSSNSDGEITGDAADSDCW